MCVCVCVCVCVCACVCVEEYYVGKSVIQWQLDAKFADSIRLQ